MLVILIILAILYDEFVNAPDKKNTIPEQIPHNTINYIHSERNYHELQQDKLGTFIERSRAVDDL